MMTFSDSGDGAPSRYNGEAQNRSAPFYPLKLPGVPGPGCSAAAPAGLALLRRPSGVRSAETRPTPPREPLPRPAGCAAPPQPRSPRRPYRT